jgi:hypothetical protein
MALIKGEYFSANSPLEKGAGGLFNPVVESEFPIILRQIILDKSLLGLV